jgi:hypothetical protein
MEVEGAYDDVVKDVDIVVHMASPLAGTGGSDNEASYLIPAREGILSMLRSAKKSPSVKRVVITSSSAAVRDSSVPSSVPYVLVYKLYLIVDGYGRKQIGTLKHGKMESRAMLLWLMVFRKSMPKKQHGSSWRKRNPISISLH